MSRVNTEPDDATRSDATLYARLAPELVRFATVLVGPSGADDLVADAVVAAFTHPNWSSVEQRRAYLYRAVLNAARQHERATSRRRFREQRAAHRESVESASVQPELLAAMRRLDPRQRAIVFFTFWQDRTTDDIAADMRISARTVQRELADAKRQLEEALR